MSLDTQSTIDRDDVTSRIEELEESATPQYKVYRTKNGEDLRTFEDEDAAQNYIFEQDYDTARVKVRELPGELDSDDAQELEDLRNFDSEALNDIDSWDYGVTVYSADYIDGSYARERAQDNAGNSVDLDSWPYNLIDWDEAADQLKDDADGAYATLNGTRFYYL